MRSQSTLPRTPLPNVRHGVTLVELLVVVAIIGLLMAVLMPAVMAARSAARQTQCKNKLKQIGYALQLYHNMARTFPMGNVPRRYWTFQTMLLPFLEQEALYRKANFAAPDCFKANQAMGGLGVPSERIVAYECPSDPRVGLKWTSPTYGVYATGSYFGVIGTAIKKKDGMLFSGGTVRLEDVLDGTSTTLFVGERGQIENLVWGWWSCGSGDNVGSGDADNLLTTKNGLTAGGPEHVHGRHFWSLHEGGGANFVYVDGSVRFLTYQIDFTTFQSLSTRAGHEVVGEY